MLAQGRTAAQRAAILTLVLAPPAGTALAMRLLWQQVVGWSDIALLVGLYIPISMGITIGFHRFLTHRGFRTNPVLKAAMLILGSMAGRKLLAPFQAAGRMPLTVYLFTSLLMMWIVFAPWGLDLFGAWGQARMLGFSLLVIAAELVAANLWLRRYENGPMEWLWKSLAYERREPFRKLQSEPPAPAPAPI